MSKATGLAAFTRKGVTASQQPAQGQNAEAPIAARQRGRGKGDVVALTVRLPRAEWERVHQLAVSRASAFNLWPSKGCQSSSKKRACLV